MGARHVALALAIGALLLVPASRNDTVEVLVRVSDLTVLDRLPQVLRSVSDRVVVVATTDPVGLAAQEGVEWVAPDVVYRAAREPNDPCWDSCDVMLGGQANLESVGAEIAWGVSTGSSEVVVGVLDTEVDAGHPELQGKVRAGPDLRADSTCRSPDATLRGHGTAIASVVAAATDDGVGIAGLGWATSVLAIPVLDDCGDGTASSVASGIGAAVDGGARIINLSLTGPPHPAVRDALVDARRRGVLVVAAAGNEGSSELTYPAAYDSVIAVGSTDRSNGALSWFTTRGPWVDIVAPGEDVLAASTVGGGYWIYDGTSFSSPLVAGAAALLLAVHPHFDADDLEANLARSARPLDSNDVRWGALDAGELLVQHEGGLALAEADGGVLTYGSATFQGSLGDLTLAEPVVGIAGDTDAYWLAAADGGVFAFGAAPFLGSAAGSSLQSPIVGIASTPTRRGYWLVAADGGVFNFGDAPFLGSAADLRLAQPVVAIAATPSGHGYWLAARDGGVFAFGDAPFAGSVAGRGGASLVGIAAAGPGSYWLVDRAGIVSGFGGARVVPPSDDSVVREAAVGIVPSPLSTGYWVITVAGRPAAFGHVIDDGITQPHPTSPIVGAVPDTGGH